LKFPGGGKYLSRRGRWAALRCSLLIALATLLANWGASAHAQQGYVQVAIQSTLETFNNEPIASDYQRVLLNVLAVRLNPSTDTTISDFAPAWVEIPAPAAVGLANPSPFISTSSNYTGTGTVVTAATSILQLDLVPLQNLPIFFNAAEIGAGTYGQVELVLNSANPSSVVPLCHSGEAEGCITFNAAVFMQKKPSSTADGETAKKTSKFVYPKLRAKFIYPVKAGVVQPLLIDLITTVGRPSKGTPVTANLVITPRIRPIKSSPIPSSLGEVTGKVNNFVQSSTTVTAELHGTNQVIAITHLLGKGTFSLFLPAQPAGTLYDMYVSGNGGFVVMSGVTVIGGSSIALSPVTVPSSSLGLLRGTISDGCNGLPIGAATLSLLVPDLTKGAATCQLTGSPPAIPPNCVVVATATTDDLGQYPPPLTRFAEVALKPPPGVPHYDLEISAPGYNTTVQPITPGSVVCPDSVIPNTCSFGLEHGFLVGTAELSNSNETGATLNALVTAEDSGTNNIENISLASIPPGTTSGPFTISVPIAEPSSNAIGVSSYDLFGSIQDLFEGTPQKTSGNEIGVVAGVRAPNTDCNSRTIPPLSAMDCVGLGSVSGNVTPANPNDPSATSVRLAKEAKNGNLVQIMETEPNSIVPLPAPDNNYAFCAPHDTYTLQHFESGSSEPVSQVTVPLNGPKKLKTPCPEICPTGSTCKVCVATTAPALP
jgi:hypothetical protein